MICQLTLPHVCSEYRISKLPLQPDPQEHDRVEVRLSHFTAEEAGEGLFARASFQSGAA